MTAPDAPVALIPAAGLARRLGFPETSKEVQPVRFGAGTTAPRPVAEYLLDGLAAAGVGRALMILRRGKWDIPEVLGGGDRFGLRLAYLVTEATPGTPFTLDQAFPLLGDSRVLLAFPDILFEPNDAFRLLLVRASEGDADIVLGLFPAGDPRRMDMVELGGNGRVVDIVIKPESTHLTLTWVLAVWSAGFTRFMHDHLRTIRSAVSRGCYPEPDRAREPYVGDVIKAAMAQGMRVEGVAFESGRCIDIGTPEDLSRLSG